MSADDIVFLENIKDTLSVQLDEVYDTCYRIQDTIDSIDDFVKNYSGNSIQDVDTFIDKLKLDNLYSEEMEKFIENYMKFYN